MLLSFLIHNYVERKNIRLKWQIQIQVIGSGNLH